uniref:Mitochondrial import receptor subunit TOM7 homolog n=1 Tax=Taeniopygia guttata TaxID=59729 RepID=A0A674GC52_TAEGU
METHFQFPPGTLFLITPSLPFTYRRHFPPCRGGVCATPRELREGHAQECGRSRGGQKTLSAYSPRTAPLGRCRSLSPRGPQRAEPARSPARTPPPPFPGPAEGAASPAPRPAAGRWVPPSARLCCESGCAPPPSPPLPPPPLCPAAGMPKLSKEAKQRLQQLFKGGQFAIRWGFIPVVLYLGFKRGADPGMPEPTIWSLLWG